MQEKANYRGSNPSIRGRNRERWSETLGRIEQSTEVLALRFEYVFIYNQMLIIISERSVKEDCVILLECTGVRINALIFSD